MEGRISGRLFRSFSPTLVLIVIMVLTVYIIAAFNVPDGIGDGLEIWNLHAKYLLLSPASLFDGHLAYQHIDYPPLIPTIIAVGWALFGVTPLVPIILHLCVLMGVVGLMLTNNRLSDHWWVLWIVGAVSAQYAATQYADLAVACSSLGAVVAYRKNNEPLVGLALGLGLLTKNEGAMLAGVLLLTWMVMERRIVWRAMLAVLPFLLVLMGWKLIIPVTNDLVAGIPDIPTRLLNYRRYLVILVGIVFVVTDFGPWALPLTAVLTVVSRIKLRWSVPAVALSVMLVGYLGIYAITPHDLWWHIQYSFDRLILHLFPAFMYDVILGYNPDSEPAEA